MSLLVLSLLSACRNETKRAPDTSPAPRVVSLSPGITETIERLGASRHLVAFSDYCADVVGLDIPRVGSALTPNYEGIARARPDLIVTTDVAGSQLKPLHELAKTIALPWLELDQVLDSTVRLGQLLDRTAEATALAGRMREVLSVPEKEGSPRVLWVLDLGVGASNDTWFIRDDSLHGAVLRAAGGTNAVSKSVTGPPKLSAEELLRIDPDAILLVHTDPSHGPGALSTKEQELKRHFARWQPLSAVKNEKLLVVHHPQAMTLGPGVLELVETIASALGRLALEPKFKAEPRQGSEQSGIVSP